MNAPNRCGQVWKDGNDKFILIVRKPRLTRWGNDVGLHDALSLDDGYITALVEFDDRPLELSSSMVRIV